MIDADGTGLVEITSPPPQGADMWSDWGPNNRIAFTMQRLGRPDHIAVVRSDGTGMVQLTADNSSYDGYPAWSPDGKRIAFARAVFLPGGGVDNGLFVMKADGSGVVRLVHLLPGRVLSNPQWASDASRIAFNVDDFQFCSQVWMVNANGTGLTQVTGANDTEAGCNEFGAWSGDGGKILFSTNRDGNFEIYVMNSDGSEPVNLTHSASGDIQPAW